MYEIIHVYVGIMWVCLYVFVYVYVWMCYEN